MEYAGFAPADERTPTSSTAATGRRASSSRSGCSTVRVVAGMNVNVWDVNESIQALVRSGRMSTVAALRDPDVPLDQLRTVSVMTATAGPARGGRQHLAGRPLAGRASVSGDLDRLIAERDVVGITTNPTIFADAFADGTALPRAVGAVAAGRGGEPRAEAALALMTDDVRAACDILLPGARGDRRTRRPGLHRGQPGGRPRRPGCDARRSAAGCATSSTAPTCSSRSRRRRRASTAIEDAIAAGHQRQRHADLRARALPAGDRRLRRGARAGASRGRDLARIHSVASFFVSRVDVEVDRRLEASAASARMPAAGRGRRSRTPASHTSCSSSRSSTRAGATSPTAGANPQRPLWASTGVKDRDGCATRSMSRSWCAPHTVNTMPEKTLDAVRRPRPHPAGCDHRERGRRPRGDGSARRGGGVDGCGVRDPRDRRDRHLRRLLGAVARRRLARGPLLTRR